MPKTIASYEWNVTVVRKTNDHPWFGKGSPNGYSVNGTQGPDLILMPGTRVLLRISTPGHPFYFTQSPTGGPQDTAKALSIPGYINDSERGEFYIELPGDYAGPEMFYYQCHAHPRMGGTVRVASTDNPLRTVHSGASIKMRIGSDCEYMSSDDHWHHDIAENDEFMY